MFPKDFIETAEGLIFAVVMTEIEQSRVLCFLRYIKIETGWEKLATEQANAYLSQNYPQYLYYSPILDTQLHGVPSGCIVAYHQPKQRLQQFMQSTERDTIENDAYQLCALWQQNGVDLTQIGITGSLLIGVQTPVSDIDIVCYQRRTFYQCRDLINTLIEQKKIQPLTEQDWFESYQRRDCALSFTDYVWHEQRKLNKAMINGRKFDLSFLNIEASSEDAGSYQKCGAVTLQCKVIDDSRAFDYPAEFTVDDEQISSIVSFTATYTGQAQRGEIVEVSGTVEQNTQGIKRLVIGSTREAHGEYLRVIHG
jgi:uncharacterized protein